ncbi:MAG: AroM family protein [Chloroflexota bacterium]
MVSKSIGALVIGQTPRPDLVDPLQEILPDILVKQVGGLDGLTETDLPDFSQAAYPLTTRMNNGHSVFISEAFIQSRLQEKLNQLESEGVVASILLCAGTFGTLVGKRPLIKPFNIGLNLLRSLNLRRIGLIAPFPAQMAPIEARWQRAGFKTAVWTADIKNQDINFHAQLQTQVKEHHLQAILLDYVGHHPDAVRQLQESIELPLINLGSLAISTMATILKS